ncbi:MAG: response regulator transcription factor [Bacteroidota bacterium]|nr:response regulator transcription factor [Bacteroidota bacterium]
MKDILLVEDDPELANLLNLHFSSQSYNLVTAGNGKDAIKEISALRFNLIILDIGLPDTNGLELCKLIRKKDMDVPIMMLTADGEESDKVLALELGADDYVTKPFGVLELLARTKALLRRAENNHEKDDEDTVINYKDLTVDAEKRKACIHGERLDLTPKEFDLLLLLASNPGKTFSRHELLEMIWGVAFLGYEHTITSHINRLRLKIENNLQRPEYILTSWGTGYRFSE